MTYQCPVCGYDELTKPPKDFYICPCCGTEFENDDFDRTHGELRQEWITNRMPWFSRAEAVPKNWSPYRQLIIAGHGKDLVAHPNMKSDETFRYSVDEAFSDVRIAKQLRLLRETRKQPLTQSALAEKAEMKQSRISELEGMNYSSWSVSTLKRLAQALGVRFAFVFEGWRDLGPEIEGGLATDNLYIPSFEDDPAFSEEIATNTMSPVVISVEGLSPVIRPFLRMTGRRTPMVFYGGSHILLPNIVPASTQEPIGSSIEGIGALLDQIDDSLADLMDQYNDHIHSQSAEYKSRPETTTDFILAHR